MGVQPSVCFDTETTGLNPINAELVGIAFSWEKHKGYYVPLPEDSSKAQEVVEKLRPFFENETPVIINDQITYQQVEAVPDIKDNNMDELLDALGLMIMNLVMMK